MKNKFMATAIQISKESMEKNEGGPFGAVVVKDGKIIAKGKNQVTSTNDPTNHAEIVAIRKACHKLGTFQLDGCEIYTSCEPCPMCLGAIYWARPSKVYYANTRHDAQKIGFDDEFIYQEILKPIQDRKIKFEQISHQDALKVFQDWETKKDKKMY